MQRSPQRKNTTLGVVVVIALLLMLARSSIMDSDVFTNSNASLLDTGNTFATLLVLLVSILPFASLFAAVFALVRWVRKQRLQTQEAVTMQPPAQGPLSTDFRPTANVRPVVLVNGQYIPVEKANPTPIRELQEGEGGGSLSHEFTSSEGMEHDHLS